MEAAPVVMMKALGSELARAFVGPSIGQQRMEQRERKQHQTCCHVQILVRQATSPPTKAVLELLKVARKAEMIEKTALGMKEKTREEMVEDLLLASGTRVGTQRGGCCLSVAATGVLPVADLYHASPIFLLRPSQQYPPTS